MYGLRVLRPLTLNVRNRVRNAGDFPRRGRTLMAGKRMNGEACIDRRNADGRWFAAIVVATNWKTDAQDREGETKEGAR